MRVIFGDKKVAITAGLCLENEHGCVKLQKLIKAGVLSESNIADMPVVLEFKTLESVDLLIEALHHTRGLMENK